MTSVFVQFSDATEATIVSVFSCSQDPAVWPNQATIDSSDSRYLAFRNPPAAQAQAALTKGLAITSNATPALNGTYACDQLSQMNIIAIETSLNAGKNFPGGATTFNYPDVTGAMHAFSETNFANFAAAVRDYVYQLKSVIAGASTTLPSTSATIS